MSLLYVFILHTLLFIYCFVIPDSCCFKMALYVYQFEIYFAYDKIKNIFDKIGMSDLQRLMQNMLVDLSPITLISL